MLKSRGYVNAANTVLFEEEAAFWGGGGHGV
jgi:hypothetical protein